MRFAPAVLAALLAFPWLAQSQTLPVAASPAAPTPAAPSPRDYLWEVSSLTNRIYLYGTVHAGKPSFYPLPEPVEKAFASSPALAVEADITDRESMSRGADAMLLKPPDTLAKHVPPALYERFRRQLDRLGVPEEALRQTKPFLAATFAAFAEWGRLGYAPQYGVDGYLLVRGKEAGKRIVELEGAQAQTDLMDSLTEAEQLATFEGTVDALERGLLREQITGVVNAWQSGDPALLLEVMRTYNEGVPGAAEIENKFIWSRHDAMTKKIEAFLLNGRETVFVAVGALHLAGPRGLVEILRRSGYTVRQL
jgi:uncharacterized protein YbaP (TraB family)